MAKVKGPLMSIEASGTFANTLVYSKWKGRQYTRKHTIPENPKTVKQVNVRTALSLVIALWHTVNEAGQTAWGVFAEGTGMSGFNQFCSRALKEYPIQLTTDVTPASVSYVLLPPDETWTWVAV